MDKTTITLRAQPGARRNEIAKDASGLLRVKVAGPAVEGKANQALLAYLANLLDVRPARLSILSGARGRLKVVAVDGLDQATVETRLAQALDTPQLSFNT